MSFRTYGDLTGRDRSAMGDQVAAQRQRVHDRLASVGSVIAVASGKGGVGKSLVTAAMAVGLRAIGRTVGIADADLRGPTAARLVGAHGPLRIAEDGVVPAEGRAGIRVVSSEFLAEDGRPLAWRGAQADRFVWTRVAEVGVVREFLGDVRWGALDYLLIDLPPGADVASELVPLVPRDTGVVIVTIPTEESRHSVARTMSALVEAGVDVLGIVENMAGYRCGGCETVQPLFPGAAADRLAETFGVPVLARVPFQPELASLEDEPACVDLAQRIEQRLRRGSVS